jgi:hypothetical protein
LISASRHVLIIRIIILVCFWSIILLIYKAGLYIKFLINIICIIICLFRWPLISICSTAIVIVFRPVWGLLLRPVQITLVS